MTSYLDTKRVSPLPLNDFLVMDLPKREYIVKPFLPQKGLIEVYAAPGIGKTTFAITFSIAAALGKCFLHWEVTRPWRVLYIDGEMEAADIRERIAATAKYFNVNSNDITNFQILSADLNDGVLPDIGSTYAHETYKEMFEWAEVIILDNISSLWLSSKENDADAWSPIRKWLSEIKSTGRSVVLIHHANKSGTSRGSSKRHDALDTVIRLERPFKYEQQDGAIFEVHYEKGRGFFGKDKEPIGLRYSTVSGCANWESFVIGLEKYEQVANLRNQGLNQQAIADQLGLSQGEVSKRLGTAAKKGLL